TLSVSGMRYPTMKICIVSDSHDRAEPLSPPAMSKKSPAAAGRWSFPNRKNPRSRSAISSNPHMITAQK
ncbi:MAG: hypothetical protein WCE58_12945, partial [Gallionella sp.]